LREHLQDLQKRTIRSSTILAVFNQFCYVPKHTVGEQLLQVREAKREQAAYESATLFRKWRSVMRQDQRSEMADRRGIGCSRCTQLPKNDDVYGALQRADTVGMFQVESRSQMA
jgi:hypothetical protein